MFRMVRIASTARVARTAKVCGRVLLVALLVAMIPAKGFAAARMLFCGVATEKVAMLDHSQHPGQQGNAVSAPPCHVDEGGSDEAPPTHEGSCSVCAVCSATTAVPGAAAVRAALPSASLPIPSRLIHFFGHIPPTLDRPPPG